MEEKLISQENLNTLVADLIKANHVVIGQAAPKAGKTKKTVGWKRLTVADEIVVNSKSIPSNLSYKEFVFAEAEPIFYFRNNKDNYDLIEPKLEEQKLVFLGAKPCDARSIEIMSHVFNWDYKDKFYNERAERSIVIGVACSYQDEFCFCTSVGLNPTSEAGSDLFLVPLDDKN